MADFKILPSAPPSSAPSRKKIEKQTPSVDTTQPDTSKQAPQESLELTESSQATPSLALGLDDSKPGSADAEPNFHSRFPERGRSIDIPLVRIDAQGAQILNPLPASGLSRNQDGIILEKPPTEPHQIFASIDAPSQMVAALFDDLSTRYPTLEKSVLWRLAVVSTYIAIDVPLMVAAHEMGHGGAALDACPSCSTEVVMTGWMSGYTRYNYPDDYKITPQEDLLSSVAGMNQATFNGEEINRRMHTEGADIKDAIGYLANITNSVNYQIKDWVQNSEPGYNDAATYHAIMEARDKGWNQQNLSLLALGVNLLNADFWASLIGSANYIATGKQVKLPEIQIGQTHMSLPHFSLIHTYEGPQLNTSLYFHQNTPTTLELKYSQILTPDQGPALGIESQLHNIVVPGTQGQVSLSPKLGFSTYQGQLGIKTGSEIVLRPKQNPHLAITAGVDYRHNYLPDRYLPGVDDLSFNSGLSFSF